MSCRVVTKKYDIPQQYVTSTVIDGASELYIIMVALQTFAPHLR